MLAIILSAGFGERLRPLTNKIPKVLIPVKGIPVIAFQIYNLKKYGVEDIIINLHWLPNIVREVVGTGEDLGVKIEYFEEKDILGNGGTLLEIFRTKKVEKILASNGDTICDVAIDKLMKFHRENNSDATLVCCENSELSSIKVKNNRIIKILPEGRGDFAFCGTQIVSNWILDYGWKRNKPLTIVDIYRGYLSSKNIVAYKHNGFFADIGTLERLKLAEETIENLPDFKRVREWSEPIVLRTKKSEASIAEQI